MVTKGEVEPRELASYRKTHCGMDGRREEKCAACKRTTEDVAECYTEDYGSDEPSEDPEITTARQQEE